jgi:amino acid permease
MVGPEFIAMTAGEAKNPRKLMHRAFSSFVWRLLLFFLGGALCVGIVIPYNDPLLLKYINGTEGGTGAAYAPLSIPLQALNTQLTHALAPLTSFQWSTLESKDFHPWSTL